MTVTVSGYAILTAWMFYLSIFYLVLVSIGKTYQSLKTGLMSFPNTFTFVENTLLRVVFPTLFAKCGNVVKYGLSCLIHYVNCVSRLKGPLSCLLNTWWSLYQRQRRSQRIHNCLFLPTI